MIRQRRCWREGSAASISPKRSTSGDGSQVLKGQKRVSSSYQRVRRACATIKVVMRACKAGGGMLNAWRCSTTTP